MLQVGRVHVTYYSVLTTDSVKGRSNSAQSTNMLCTVSVNRRPRSKMAQTAISTNLVYFGSVSHDIKTAVHASC